MMLSDDFPAIVRVYRAWGRRGAAALALLQVALAAGACGRDTPFGDARARASTAHLPGAPPRAAASPSAQAPPDAKAANAKIAYLHYDITIDPQRDILSATVCPRGFALQQLTAPIDEAAPLIAHPHTDSVPLTSANGILPVGKLAATACVHYQVNLKSALALDSSDARRIDDDLLLSPDLWLWAPKPYPVGLKVSAQFHMPAGWRAAVPWPRLDKQRFRIPQSAFVWRTQAAFGTLPARVMHTGRGEVTSYVLGKGWGRRHQAVLDWVQRSAEAVTSLFGRFPTSRVQALLVTTPARSKPFGMAMHGGGNSAFMLLPQDINLRDVDSQWTVVHELLHFSLPPIVNADAWLHEGITTYLTTKARARAGIIDESFAWWELLDGFERGRHNGTGLSLREESAKMQETHAYWRVYWAGAALALAMDMKLTARGSSLEKTLLDMADKNLDYARRFNGPEVIQLLDQTCGSSIPSDASQQYLNSSEFPDTDTLAKQLGVRIKSKHHTSFNNAAPKAKLRHKLMRPASAP
ncbi:MAG TPA: hypothetical protein ENK23_08170 [Sorangium sp.]|nr:hypothetical protein [Sorangium sp.]